MYISLYVFVFKNRKQFFLNIIGGSAVPIINKSTFSNIHILLPSDTIIKRFYMLVQDIFEYIDINSKENQTLIDLRDTLLPKLMSGEIRVSDFES